MLENYHHFYVITYYVNHTKNSANTSSLEKTAIISQTNFNKLHLLAAVMSSLLSLKHSFRVCLVWKGDLRSCRHNRQFRRRIPGDKVYILENILCLNMAQLKIWTRRFRCVPVRFSGGVCDNLGPFNTSGVKRSPLCDIWLFSATLSSDREATKSRTVLHRRLTNAATNGTNWHLGRQ